MTRFINSSLKIKLPPLSIWPFCWTNRFIDVNIMKNQHNPLLSLNTNTSKQEKNTLWLHPRNIGGQIFTMSWVAEYLVWVQQTILWWGLFIFSKVTTAHWQQNICIFNNENLVRIMKLSSENASVKWKILKLKNACNYPLLSVAWLVTHEAGRSNCYFPQFRFSCAGWNSCARMSQELRAECVMAGYSQFIKWLQNWWGDSWIFTHHNTRYLPHFALFKCPINTVHSQPKAFFYNEWEISLF